MNKKFKKVYTNAIGVLSLRCGLFLFFSVFMSALFLNESASAQDKNLVVRMAKLQIDPTQLESYKAALKEEIEASVSIEPGVLTLYAVSEKDNPTHITIFEIYANTEAYKAHLETTHFKKYKSATKDMLKSLELVDVSPVALSSKPGAIK